MKYNNVIDCAYKEYQFCGIKNTGDHKVYILNNETGTGEMNSYKLCDGIQLSYNNLNMESVFQQINPCQGIIKIDHCLEGCYKFKLRNEKTAFIGKGDLSIIDLGEVPFESSTIPMNKYIGLSLFIDINVAQRSLKKIFPYGDIDLLEISSRLCGKGPALIIRSRKEINHIIAELYDVDERVRIPYSLIKTLELLLFLKLVEKKDMQKLPCFSEPIYKATQECYKGLIKNPFDKYSISELAKKYAISESSLKRCFIYITGNSIGAFKKKICLEAAAELLIHRPEITIGEIAELAGYLNQSKFSSAFKSYFGDNPQKYKSKSI